MSTIAKYLRLPSEDDDLKLTGKLESNSIANQRNLLDSFIKRAPEFADAEIMEFCDDGWSGKNFERPAVQEMLDLVRQGKIQCIIVKDLSRFGRDYLTVGNYISRVFPFMGVRFIAINDGFDSIRPMDADSLETSFLPVIVGLWLDIMLGAPAIYRQAAAAAVRHALAPRQKVLLLSGTPDRHLVHDPLPPVYESLWHSLSFSQTAKDYAIFVQGLSQTLREALHSISYSRGRRNPPDYLTLLQ